MLKSWFTFTSLRKVKKLDYVSKASEWDEESLAWVNQEFKWEGVEVEDEEVRCDDQGQKVMQVEV